MNVLVSWPDLYAHYLIITDWFNFRHTKNEIAPHISLFLISHKSDKVSQSSKLLLRQKPIKQTASKQQTEKTTDFKLLFNIIPC